MTRPVATRTPDPGCTVVEDPVCVYMCSTYVTRYSSVHSRTMKCCVTQPVPNTVYAVDWPIFAQESLMQDVSRVLDTLMPEVQVCLWRILLIIFC